MPRHYPAMKLKMGSWDYYSVKITMRDVATEIKFAREVNDDKTLDSAIQRGIMEGRAGKAIVNYLTTRDNRFFNSLVVAALDGNPQFFPIRVEEDPTFAMFADVVSETFGMLVFDDTIKTYALDGQHRLFAIRKLIEGGVELGIPPGFEEETLNVIFVVPRDDDDRDSFLKAYRSLFSALNRHAKPTDKVTNIIMDEIDRFAILTRRLVSDYPFFSWDNDNDNPRVDTSIKSENLSDTNPAFVSLVGLYKIVSKLLWDNTVRETYGVHKENHPIIEDAPTDEEVEDAYDYLVRIWDALIDVLPKLEEDPIQNRVHGSPDGKENNLLFRPIGQVDVLAPMARMLMNNYQLEENGISSTSSYENIRNALTPLSYVPWDLMHDVWRDLLVVQKPEGGWKMADENRKQRLETAQKILVWVLGIEDLTEDHLDEIKQEWTSWLGAGQTEDREEVFEELEEIRNQILAL